MDSTDKFMAGFLVTLLVTIASVATFGSLNEDYTDTVNLDNGCSITQTENRSIWHKDFTTTEKVCREKL